MFRKIEDLPGVQTLIDPHKSIFQQLKAAESGLEEKRRQLSDLRSHEIRTGQRSDKKKSAELRGEIAELEETVISAQTILCEMESQLRAVAQGEIERERSIVMKSQGGLPRERDLRFSKLAENLAHAVLAFDGIYGPAPLDRFGPNFIFFGEDRKYETLFEETLQAGREKGRVQSIVDMAESFRAQLARLDRLDPEAEVNRLLGKTEPADTAGFVEDAPPAIEIVVPAKPEALHGDAEIVEEIFA